MSRALLLCCLFLAACAGPIAVPDPRQAWVDVSSAPGNVLLAERLDRLSVKDGRYYQLQPGPHQLQLRLQFALPGGNGREHFGDDTLRTCLFNLDYGHFQAGQRYRIRAGQQGYRGWVRLYDAQGQLLVRGRQSRCGAL
jgi:hypothetical protein